jgi:hypothetical protein
MCQDIHHAGSMSPTSDAVGEIRRYNVLLHRGKREICARVGDNLAVTNAILRSGRERANKPITQPFFKNAHYFIYNQFVGKSLEERRKEMDKLESSNAEAPQSPGILNHRLYNSFSRLRSKH